MSLTQLYNIKKTTYKKSSNNKPVLPLIPEKVATEDDSDKSLFIGIHVKACAGGPNDHTYKKYVRKFEEGTPQAWINLIQDVQEIWTQNSINGGQDRASTLKALLRGETLDSFETALQDARTGDDRTVAPLTPEMIDISIQQVAKEVFPHRAIEKQKQWMERDMRKPATLSTRQTAAAITRINNSFPFFPNATEQDKYSDRKIVELLELSLPIEWQDKFNMDGYIPTDGSKKKLVEACEAIERHLSHESREPTKGNESRKAKKNSNRNSKRKRDGNNDKEFFCKIHGKNTTHNSAQCKTLQYQNKAKPGKEKKGKDGFKKPTKLNEESNALTKSYTNDKLVKMLNAVKTKLALAKKSKSRQSGDSDDEVENFNLEKPIPRKKVKKTRIQDEATPEEKEYQKQFLESLMEESATDDKSR